LGGGACATGSAEKWSRPRAPPGIARRDGAPLEAGSDPACRPITARCSCDRRQGNLIRRGFPPLDQPWCTRGSPLRRRPGVARPAGSAVTAVTLAVTAVTLAANEFERSGLSRMSGRGAPLTQRSGLRRRSRRRLTGRPLRLPTRFALSRRVTLANWPWLLYRGEGRERRGTRPRPPIERSTPLRLAPSDTVRSLQPPFRHGSLSPAAFPTCKHVRMKRPFQWLCQHERLCRPRGTIIGGFFWGGG
jgi:hypothetical protein